MERIEFLEKKVKEKNDEHAQDNQRFISIIGKSMDNFKNLFEDASLNTTQQLEYPDSTITSFAENWRMAMCNYFFICAVKIFLNHLFKKLI